MVHHSQFIIRNDRSESLILNIEPEGVFVPLQIEEEVTVTDNFQTNPVTVKLSNSDRGDTILSIWPGDGAVKVEKNGKDVLDLLQERVSV